MWQQLYFCGGMAIAVALIWMMLKIAGAVSKRDDANAAAWRQINQAELDKLAEEESAEDDN